MFSSSYFPVWTESPVFTNSIIITWLEAYSAAVNSHLFSPVRQTSVTKRKTYVITWTGSSDRTTDPWVIIKCVQFRVCFSFCSTRRCSLSEQGRSRMKDLAQEYRMYSYPFTPTAFSNHSQILTNINLSIIIIIIIINFKNKLHVLLIGRESLRGSGIINCETFARVSYVHLLCIQHFYYC